MDTFAAQEAAQERDYRSWRRFGVMASCSPQNRLALLPLTQALSAYARGCSAFQIINPQNVNLEDRYLDGQPRFVLLVYFRPTDQAAFEAWRNGDEFERIRIRIELLGRFSCRDYGDEGGNPDADKLLRMTREAGWMMASSGMF